MEITATSNENGVHFVIHGDIDEQGAEDLKANFERYNSPHLNEAVFDFRNVTYIGSAGLGKFLLFYKSLASRGGCITIENPPDSIHSLLKQLKLDAILQIK